MEKIYELSFSCERQTRTIKCTFEHELNDRQQTLLKELVREEMRKEGGKITWDTPLSTFVSCALVHFNEEEGMFGSFYYPPSYETLVIN